MNLIKLGHLLKNRRDELGLSLRDASKKVNLSHNYLSVLEKAKDPKSNMPIKPTIDTLKLISEGYEININELLDLAGYDFEIVPKEKEEKKAKLDDGITSIAAHKLNIKDDLPDDAIEKINDFIRMVEMDYKNKK